MGVQVRSEDCTGEKAGGCLRSRWDVVNMDPARPRFHFCPMAGWMNDPNGGIYADGEYHFFYLQDPFDADGFSGTVMPDGSVLEGKEKPNRFWGHTKTRDFIHWDYLPEALVPDRDSGEVKPISGSVIKRADGSCFLAFTSVREGGKYSQCGAVAYGGLTRWKRLEKPLVELPKGLGVGGDWRDPYLFTYEGKTYMVIGAATREKALLLLYEAEDKELLQWRYQGIFLDRPVEEVAFFECPRVLLLGGKMVLLFSPYKQVEYYTGEFDPAEGSFLVEQTGYVDHGVVAYASVDVKNDKGETYLLTWTPGWFNRKKLSFEGWNGCVTTPRRIWLGLDGKLCQIPCKAIEAMREEKLFQWQANDPDSSKQRMDCICVEGLPLQFELSVESNTWPVDDWQLEFCDSETGEVVQALRVQDGVVLIDGDEIPMTRDRFGLRCIRDGFLWEYFIGEGESVITSGTREIPAAMNMQIVGNWKAFPFMKVTIWKIMDAKFRDCML